jgi:spermidine/putrescine transport system ATP-binding protein
VAFGLERKKVAKDEIKRRVGEILEIVSLTGMEKRAPREMSGGQQQRVALARALVNRPRALLLDEPLGALDLKLRQQMQVELKRIQRDVGITFVYVTHDQGEALTMSDRIAVMNTGLIEQLGTPREIYERPSTRFVAGFIGTSNIVEGNVERTDNGLALVSYTTQDRVVVPVGSSVRAGDKIEVSIRPEKIDMHRGVPPVTATGGSVLSGVVNEVVYHGTSTNYTVATAAGADFTVFDQNATNADDLAGRGDRVFLTWAPQHSYMIGV